MRGIVSGMTTTRRTVRFTVKTAAALYPNRADVDREIWQTEGTRRAIFNDHRPVSREEARALLVEARKFLKVVDSNHRADRLRDRSTGRRMVRR